MKALIVVDMVKGFVKEQTKKGKCALYLPEAKNIIAEINTLMKENDLIIYVNDNHKKNDKEFRKYPPHCIKGTEESEIADGFLRNNGTPVEVRIIEKTRYSGFYRTRLERTLNCFNVDEVIITGVCTEICVLATALDAVMRNYKVTVPAKAVSGLTKEGHEWALKYMKDILGVNII